MVRTVAVTGATGFIGRVLVAKLAASGWRVRALARRVSSQEDNPFIEWISGDLGCSGALCNLVSGTEAVIHCAGAIRGKSWADFYQTNVIGTSNILQAASDTASCSRFLHISSLAAREPLLSWYARSKFEAEEQVSRFTQLASVIYRPAAVYGPGDKAMLPFFQSMRYGILPVPGNPGNRFGLIHVDDLVAAICCWLETDHPMIGTYAIDDGTSGGYDYTSIAMLAQQVLEKPVRCFRIPASSMRMLARLNLWSARLLNYAPMLTPGKVMELEYPDWTCDVSFLRKELVDWYPTIKLQTALPSLVKT
ncbi:NAD-dependent epimerase/dehydratase family protein [Nitrosomonas sp. HPC101]|uniref:NAD-dependent epimerase/dehydratase family protein n=1 Tax=Nitrosomonas sp. HPC101 TaxID=1658667 RepID=UPI00136EFF6A|nr:NAD-dependent epimerase/dehydratase family protein [Nitrosomonas sp. HPC101]MXS86197.1 NAD-dependent epimerase/dehydratase family protein [Nitrosomonas sp. HPC101]